MRTKEQIRQFITSELISNDNGKKLEDATPLLESGIIDSLGMIKLVVFLENKFSIQVTDQELQPENFKNLDALSLMVEGKIQ